MPYQAKEQTVALQIALRLEGFWHLSVQATVQLYSICCIQVHVTEPQDQEEFDVATKGPPADCILAHRPWQQHPFLSASPLALSTGQHNKLGCLPIQGTLRILVMFPTSQTQNISVFFWPFSFSWADSFLKGVRIKLLKYWDKVTGTGKHIIRRCWLSIAYQLPSGYCRSCNSQLGASCFFILYLYRGYD